MGQQSVDRIIEILKNAHQQQMVEQEGKRRQEEQDSLAQNRLAVRDQADKEFQQHVKEKEAEHKIAQQTADLHMKIYKLQGQQTLNEAGKTYEETGRVPGANVAPMSTSAAGASYSPANPQQATGGLLTIPGLEDLGSIQVARSPEAAATRRANISKIEDRPKVDAKIEESRALQADMLNKQAEAKQADLDRANAIKMYDDTRADKKIVADAEEARLNRASHERVARIQAGSRDPGELDLTPIAQDAINAKVSLESINKLGMSKLKKTQLINAITGTGARILSQPQVDLVNDFPQMVNAVKYMDEVIQQQPKTHNSFTSNIAGAYSSLTNPELVASEKELEARSSLVARFLKEKGNLSNTDTKRVMGMFPSRYNTLETNIKKRDDYVQELEKLIDAKLDSVSPAQRNIIKKRLGLMDIGLYGSQHQPAQSQAPASGATHVWTPQGIQPVGAGK